MGELVVKRLEFIEVFAPQKKLKIVVVYGKRLSYSATIEGAIKPRTKKKEKNMKAQKHNGNWEFKGFAFVPSSTGPNVHPKTGESGFVRPTFLAPPWVGFSAERKERAIAAFEAALKAGQTDQEAYDAAAKTI